MKVRQEASRQLSALGESARAALAEALAKATSEEVRARINELLAALASPIAPSAEALREVRAIGVLETIGTDDAKKVLEALAAGGPGRLTDLAKAALGRLEARGQ
jgi:hypothetical protein